MMKFKIKKEIKFLIVLFVCAISILVVGAFNNNDTLTTNIVVAEDFSNSGSNGANFMVSTKQAGFGLTGAIYGGEEMFDSAYNSTLVGDTSGETYTTFCLDPSHYGPNGTKTIPARAIEYQMIRTLDGSDPYDRALIYLYENTLMNGGSSLDMDFIVNTTSRLLTVHYGQNRSAGPLGVKYDTPYINTVACYDGGSCSNIITGPNMDRVKELYLGAINASSVTGTTGLRIDDISIENNDTGNTINRTVTGTVVGSGTNFTANCTGGISCSVVSAPGANGGAFTISVSGSLTSISSDGAEVVISMRNTGAVTANSVSILEPVVNAANYQRMVIFGADIVSKSISIAPAGDSCMETNFDSNFCTSPDGQQMYVTELQKHNTVDYLTCLTDDGEIGTQEDAAGNSLNVVEGNPYCSINCGEEWEFSVPGEINNVIAGTYFMMSTTMQGTKVCASVVDYDKFDTEYDNLMVALARNYTEYLKTKALSDKGLSDLPLTCPDPDDPDDVITINGKGVTASYDTYGYNPSTQQIYKTGTASAVENGSCDNPIPTLDVNRSYESTISSIQRAITNINACSPSDTSQFALEFDPLLSYNYEETYYMSIIGSNNYYISMGNDNPGVTATYTTANSTNSSFSNVTDGAITYDTVSLPSCNDSGCTSTSKQVPTTTYGLYQSSTDSILYKPYTVFWTVHPTGEITGAALDVDDSQEAGGVVTKLGRVFPVSLTTGKGQYQYNFVYNNIGEYYDDGSLGRLMNYSGSLVDVNSSKVQNSGNSAAIDGVATASYSCNYNVIEDICKCCNDEPFKVQNGNKEELGWTGNGEAYLNYYYRPTSLNQLFGDEFLENGEVSGEIVNWSSDKGQLVYDMIDAKGEEAYITPEYSYLLTPEVISQIRTYNDEAESSGTGFADFNMECNEYGYNCSSTFLDDLANNPDEFGSDEIELARPENVVYWSNDVTVNTDLTDIRWVNYSDGYDHNAENPGGNEYALSYALPEGQLGKAMK